MFESIRGYLSSLNSMKIALILIGIYIAVLVLRYAFQTKARCEGFSNQDEPVFRMFFAEWCGHCKKAKPEFSPLVGEQTIKGKKVKIVMIDAEKEKELAKQFNVSGYPTFILTKDGQNITYDGERTQSGFRSFLEKQL